MLTVRAPVARTPLYHWHATRGARFAARDGWQMVASYGDPAKEADAAGAGVGLADVSAAAKVALRGPGVADAARSLVPDSPALKPRGVAAIPGGLGLACRLTDHHLLLIGFSPSPAALADRLATLPAGVVRSDGTSALASFELFGPRLAELLPRLTQLDLRPASFPAGSCAETAFAGVEALLVCSADRPLPSLRVHVAWDVAEHAWERILEAGHDVGVTPVGMDTLERLGAAPR